MRGLAVVLVLVTGLTTAAAAPTRELRRRAQEQLLAGEPEAALALVDEGLAAAPGDRELTLLRGHVLLKLADYDGALAAYRSYLARGASGRSKREVQRIIASLESASTTFVRVAVTNGPADVRVDARTGKPFCVANPECRRAIVPGDHLIVVDRPGHVRAARRIDIPAGQTTSLELTLVEKPSPLRVAVTPADAAVRIDGAAAGSEVAAGEHAVEVSRAGYLPHRASLRAAGGEPVELAVTLREGVTVEVIPPGATLLVDGAAVEVVDGMVPRGRVIVARLAGYRDATVTLEGRPPSVRLLLEPFGASLTVAGARGASLLLDGQARGILPLDAPLELTPGEHAIELTAPGRKPFRRTVTVAAGQQAVVTVGDLSPRRHTKAWIAAGVGVAGLAGGTLFGLQALGKQGDYDDRAPLPGTMQEDTTQTGLRDDGQRAALIADISFGVAVAAIAASVYWFATEGGGTSSGKVEVRALPGAVSLSARF